ncbi:MAG TPA: PP2C family protein-serine/threonine phosphatase [Actinocrinis sp.]|uniref:PP2C family protein-serine/threonine phosphatase n=1 Tax=Actinocrinis sp. TaxID=1920516 RepID=UPI002D752124|nr:PP2C family protein-serine/threonine phosphatase [Actinocrinis sp.]HZU57219.1 PP2C family protein-serine/threonine phosphatase [Actinocrinis sp.]
MTTATHLDPRRPERTEEALHAHHRTVRRAPVRRIPRRAWRIAVYAAPALWVACIVALSLALQLGAQLTPLLAAAPAIACAGTGRRQCIALGCACALLALLPFRPGSEEFGERLGIAPTILIVTFATYLVAQRRLRTQRAYDEVRQIAEVTQRVLLRPVPARIGSVVTAVEYLSAASGAQIGGDFYEIIETPYGVRAILGDMRGNGLDAVSGAAALLGAFREAGAVEPALEAVAVRLDAALARRASEIRHAELVRQAQQQPESGGQGKARTDALRDAHAETWAEDFATAVLVEIPTVGAQKALGSRAKSATRATSANKTKNALGSGGAVNPGGAADPKSVPEGDGQQTRHDPGAAEATLVLCGHPAPLLVHGTDTRLIESASCSLPLGLGSLVNEPYAASAITVPFGPGDSLLLYTDGVSDARARCGAFFPLEPLLRGVCDLPPNMIAGFLRGRLLGHMQGELNDDAALLVLRREG